MKEITAAAIRVSMPDANEIVLEFGNESGPSTDVEVTIAPAARIALSSATAQRLALALHQSLRNHAPPQRPAITPAAAAPAAPASPAPRQVVAAPTEAALLGGTSGVLKSFPNITMITEPAASASSPPTRPATARESVSVAGPAVAPSKPPLEALLDPTVNMPSSRAEPDPVGKQAAQLFRLVTGLGVPYVHERSFRMRHQALLPNRYLMSVGQHVADKPDELLADAFRQLGMPSEFLEAAVANLPRARCVHFGFEADQESYLLKVYLEVAEKLEGADPGGPGSEVMLEHIAYKWDPSNTERRVVGRYLHYPSLLAHEIETRVENIYAGTDCEGSMQIARDVIQLAATRMPERDIHYLEVEEEENERRSYSINFYDADLQLRDLHPMLSRMRRQYDVSPGRFQRLYDQIKTRRFGHMAGGVHRNGRDFFNVYYGPQFSDEGTWRGGAARNAAG